MALVAAGAFAIVLAASVRAQPPATAPKTTELGRGPAIVFVHGLGATRSDWMPTARKLIGKHRVVMSYYNPMIAVGAIITFLSLLALGFVWMNGAGIGEAKNRSLDA